MTLEIADIAALTGMMVVVTGALAVITRYYVKAEIQQAVNELRLELSKERASILESRVGENNKA